MALVAYDNSDSSEFEDDEPVATPFITQANKGASSIKPVLNGNIEEGVLFNLLPQPSTKKPAAVVEEDDEFLHKKETVKSVPKPKAKISVPSINDFKDVEDKPSIKPRPTGDKKSGLLSILPQPRNSLVSKSNTSLVPNVVTRKPLLPATVKKKVPLPSTVKKAKIETKGLVNNYSDESDGDDEETTDFFSINKPVELPVVDDTSLDTDVPIKSSSTIEDKAAKIESYFKKPQHVEVQPDYEESNYEIDNLQAGSSYNGHEQENTTNNEVQLDDEAIRQLCGARGKRKKEDIQIVEFNQQEVLADAREWLIKGLMDDTTKRMSSSKKTGHEPTSQQKRKHQITYLAHKAKANEAELQNQWANNRMSRRQTQSKYGF